ncbi:MAG: sigma-54 dependent transcriptional regulator [Thermodesulfovibrionales bacterium]
MSPRVLVVDDEVNFLRVISAALKKAGLEVDTARTGEEAFAKFGGDSYDLVISDYKLPGMDGEKLLEKVKFSSPAVPVILMTGYGTIERAVMAMKKGAYTYLTKPVNLDAMTSVVHEALSSSGACGEGGAAETPDQFLNIIGRSRAIKEVFTMIQRVGKTDANVLILGESGTGKELVARAIHYNSLKAGGPFIPLDCTTIPSELIESELFGHEKGAFTCAYDNKIGLIEMANGGTIFLDEIGDLDFALQKKLLRFLQEKEFHRLGGKQKIKVDARVLAATNRNIEEAVEKGYFRADLYYRLNVITIHVPPLRDRKDDIPLLASYFLETFSEKNRKEIRGFDDSVMKILMDYDWHGNVRELENTIERAVILCPYDHITPECLPRKLKSLAEESPCPEGELNLFEMEKRVITKALDNTSWNQSRAADLLGITRKMLRTKMKNLGLLPGGNGGKDGGKDGG